MHGRGLMRRQVVQHDMDVQARLDAGIDVAEERDEVLGAMLLLAAREDFARRDVQRGEQIQGAVSEVVRPPLGLADVHRQDRLRAFERLDLRFLVEGEYHGIVQWIHIQPDHVAHLLHQLRVGRDLEERVMCGFRPKVRQMRPTIV